MPSQAYLLFSVKGAVRQRLRSEALRFDGRTTTLLNDIQYSRSKRAVFGASENGCTCRSERGGGCPSEILWVCLTQREEVGASWKTDCVWQRIPSSEWKIGGRKHDVHREPEYDIWDYDCARDVPPPTSTLPLTRWPIWSPDAERLVLCLKRNIV